MDALKALRNLDLALAVLALPIFLAAGLPLLGWVAGAGAWFLQRAIRHVVERKAEQAGDARTTVGLIAGGMIGRGWLVAALIFGVGLAAGDETGLAAAVLFIALFTVFLTMGLALRPATTTKAGS